MNTRVSIESTLLERAVEISGAATNRAAVRVALEEFVARREQRKLVDLFGTLDWDDTFSFKPERSRHQVASPRAR